MGRHSCCYKQKLRRGLWSPEEDEKLLNHINKYGHGCWSSVPKLAGLQRCGKSCRLRWLNYLRPDLKRGTFSQEEENLIIELHAVLGNRWSQIAAQLQGRTDNEIKNFWNSSIKKRLRERGIDPNTYKSTVAERELEGNRTTTVGSETSDPSKLDIFNPTSGTSIPAVGEHSLPQLPFTSKNSMPLSKELFIDKFISSSRAPPNLMGLFPFSQLSSAESHNPDLCLNQTSKLLDIIAVQLYGLNPMIDMPSDNSLPGCTAVNGSALWESVSSSNGKGSNGTDLQSNSSIFEGNIYKEAHLQLEGEAEDFKWSEYLNGAFP